MFHPSRKFVSDNALAVGCDFLRELFCNLGRARFHPSRIFVSDNALAIGCDSCENCSAFWEGEVPPEPQACRDDEVPPASVANVRRVAKSLLSRYCPRQRSRDWLCFAIRQKLLSCQNLHVSSTQVLI